MTDYMPTIGLEIHAELKTRTKMFCGSLNDPHDSDPNTHVCPVCLAHPGTLPVINKEAVEHVIKVGLAVGGSLATFTEFDRKNYFYPDIPKGYQISQYKYPLVQGGELAGVKLTRIHLEEDTARSQHDQGEGSLVDYNRAGVPLMELVTEPVIHDAETAGNFARELQLLLRTINVSDANMEMGEMRVEANISVSRDATLGTKVEVKNLNSFRAVEAAIKYEIERQIDVLERQGGKIMQETRGWDDQRASHLARDPRKLQRITAISPILISRSSTSPEWRNFLKRCFSLTCLNCRMKSAEDMAISAFRKIR
jgi:aspartyl-tRNA(Asn)/glutamyl-tRNA(Gln) amidotransferase subunit B